MFVRRTSTLVTALSMVVCVDAHGAVTFPKPRNSLDGVLSPWSDWAFPCDAQHQGSNCTITFCEDGTNCEGSCPLSAHNSGDTFALNASNGQACYWFNNGCTVGCSDCDGSSNHVGHGAQSFLYNGMTSAELYAKQILPDNAFFPSAGSMILNPKSMPSLEIKPNCENPTLNSTICDTRLRTCNSQAECGSAEDIYFYSPWRAPGAAPVIDPCGSAGGRYKGQGTGGAGAQFQNTTLAKQGDKGSLLPALDSQTIWKAGDVVEVGWTVMANHGGGYAYRLAPADEPISEVNFRKMPLDFVGNSILRWGGDKTTQEEFNTTALGWETNVGTTPKGSMWRKNPIPSVLWEREGPSFEPVCEESLACIKYAAWQGRDAEIQGICRCSGHSNGGPLLPNLEIVDQLKIPSTLPPGKYVMQWRWDCEESDQVWASCSDVTIE